jgi:hypothetical protein
MVALPLAVSKLRRSVFPSIARSSGARWSILPPPASNTLLGHYPSDHWLVLSADWHYNGYAVVWSFLLRLEEGSMLLASELNANQCTDSPRQFRARLIEAMPRLFPNVTIDELVCDTRRSRQFCAAIRDEAKAADLHDAVILKTLMNIRRANECPVGLKNQRTRTLMESELRGAGCEMEKDAFDDFIVDAFAGMYHGQTVDEIVCYPDQADAYCQFVRNELPCPGLPGSLILRRLMNVRKQGTR